MGSSTAKVRLQLFGPPKIIKSTGEDCTPRGRKACALLAMLALSPENKRSRVWIQDKLWGSRGKEQGAASLRQSLAEIRKALGDQRGCLLADSYIISLDPNLFETDTDGVPPLGGDQGSELLEGLDIGEEGFEDWLRGQRQKLNDCVATKKNEPLTIRNVVHRDGGDHPVRNRVVLVRGTQNSQAEASVIADSLIDSVAKTITELGAAKILDRRLEADQQSEPDDNSHAYKTLSLRSDVFGSDTKQIVRLALLQLPSNTLAWSSTLRLPGKDSLDLNDPGVMRCINLVVNVAIDQFIKIRSEGSERAAAANLCYSGILHLFRLGKMNFETADRLFASAFEIEPRGIYLAWRAYLRTFLLAERQYTCRQTIEAEAFDFMHRALELEPHNSYVAGLSAHVQTMMRRSYVAAYELAERSIQLNHANPIGWACLGIAKSYLGKSEEGFHHTLLARSIAGSAPFRYQIDALSCIAGTMAGELDKAIHLAEASHALAPSFAPPMRYLSALYAYDGRHDLSFEMVRRLQASEPDFSYDKLRDKAYPAAGLHRTSIIDSLPARQV
jgi:tetratricopeptide (TPR) repeat protein